MGFLVFLSFHECFCCKRNSPFARVILRMSPRTLSRSAAACLPVLSGATSDGAHPIPSRPGSAAGLPPVPALLSPPAHASVRAPAPGRRGVRAEVAAGQLGGFTPEQSWIWGSGLGSCPRSSRTFNFPLCSCQVGRRAFAGTGQCLQPWRGCSRRRQWHGARGAGACQDGNWVCWESSARWEGRPERAQRGVPPLVH